MSDKIFKKHANPSRYNSDENPFFVQEYTIMDNSNELGIGKIVYRGNSNECDDLVNRLISGELKIDDALNMWRDKIIALEDEEEATDIQENSIMKILVVKPHEKPYEMDIENKLESMQSIVDGYIERIPLDKNVFLVCNEMGKVQELEGNRRVGNDVIAGTFFIVGANSYDFASLTDQQVKLFSARFEKDEIFEKTSINEWMKEVRFEPFELEDDEEYEPD